MRFFCEKFGLGRVRPPRPRLSLCKDAITRSTPGPVGLYIVSVGYFVAGVPGAVAGRAAPLLLNSARPLHWAQMEHPRIKEVQHTVVIASAGLRLAASIPMARDALTDPLTIGIAAATVTLMPLTEVDTLWTMPGGCWPSLTASSLAPIH
jgi:chromate transporter